MAEAEVVKKRNDASIQNDSLLTGLRPFCVGSSAVSFLCRVICLAYFCELQYCYRLLLMSNNVNKGRKPFNWSIFGSNERRNFYSILFRCLLFIRQIIIFNYVSEEFPKKDLNERRKKLIHFLKIGIYFVIVSFLYFSKRWHKNQTIIYYLQYF